jgi:hypothetical protein
MAVAETLFNATLVLVPIWLGVIRYATNETEFRNRSVANIVGLGVAFVLIGILFPMWISIEQLVTQSPDLEMAMFTLFGTVGLTGLGGILFIVREIENVSFWVVTGIPTGLIVIAMAVIILPQIISQLPAPSIPNFLLTVITSLISAITVSLVDILIKKLHHVFSDGSEN